MTRGRFFDWTPGPQPGRIVRVNHSDDLDALKNYYGRTPQLERVLEVAIENGARSIVVEYRYIDMDFRSTHIRFYSGKYRRYPSVCHRLHFFTGDLETFSDIGNHVDGYLGYSVMRPLQGSPVGRTMLHPPASLQDAVMCLATDYPNLFDWRLEVRGVPYITQDEQLLRCAHVVQWMVLYHSFLHGESARVRPGDVHEASGSGIPIGRSLPSRGLAPHQILSGLEALGLSPAVVDLRFASRRESAHARHFSLFATLCRLVNSQIPPIVISRDHAWIVVGYRTEGAVGGHDDIRLVCHDDAVGPYALVDDPWEDEGSRRPWVAAIVPYPKKVHLPAEQAEAVGRAWLAWHAEAQAQGGENGESSLAAAIAEGRIHYRTYAVRGRRFKEDLRESRPDVPQDLRELYCYTQWPRFVWIIEAVDNGLRNHGPGPEGPCVLGEVVLDATDHPLADDSDIVPLAMHASGHAISRAPDHDHDEEIVIEAFAPYSSGCARDLLS